MSARRAFAGIGIAALALAAGGGAARAATHPAVARAAIPRSEVIARAETWHPHTPQRIPYSQGAYHDGYRTDCSGYASMALGLAKPGTNTVGLASSSVSRPIGMGDLLTGDLVIDATGDNNTRHVVIFEKWANAAHTSYWEYEQRGGYGTDHRTVNYGLTAGSQFHAHRPLNLDGGGTPPPPPSGGKHYVDTFAAATGYGAPNTNDPRGTLNAGTNYVYCRVWGAEVRHGNSVNHWWMRTDLDRTNAGKNGHNAYVSAYYLKRWGNDQAKDNNGADLPNC